MVCRGLLAGAVVVGAMAAPWPASAGSSQTTAGESAPDTRPSAPADGPRRLHDAIADVLVRVRGGAVCSGTPITGTVYVVTAAHCVLDDQGNAHSRTVVRDGTTYSARAVLVDSRYVDEPKERLDAAVLVMDQVLPGPSATLGAAVPTAGSVTIAGFQSLDSDGTLLRGTRLHDVPRPKGVTGNLIEIESAPAGCSVPAASLSITSSRVGVPCGLIPGSSGGGLFAGVDGTTPVLVGIVSTVNFELTSNGVVPLDSLHELLLHPDDYWHDVSPTGRHHVEARVVRS
jgi:Trypsin-like peptidase domain